MRVPSTASTRLPVCSTRYCRTQLIAGVEQEEDTQRQRDDDERIERLMHHHLVDHDLRAQRCGQRNELDGERGEQHVTPHRFVPQQLGHEPPKTELR